MELDNQLDATITAY